VAVLGVGGCTTPELASEIDLTLTSRDRPDATGFGFGDGLATAIYQLSDKNSLTVLLLQGPANDPTRVIELTMLWRPRAGLTPIDRTATNATVQLLEFRDSPGEIDTLGLYAGAGFLQLHDDPAGGTLTASLRQCDLRLSDRSEAFIDRWGRLNLEGRLTARRDDARVSQLQRDLNQRVRDRLGYPRIVCNPLRPAALSESTSRSTVKPSSS
jgi:hypothetical protein